MTVSSSLSDLASLLGSSITVKILGVLPFGPCPEKTIVSTLSLFGSLQFLIVPLTQSQVIGAGEKSPVGEESILIFPDPFGSHVPSSAKENPEKICDGISNFTDRFLAPKPPVK